MFARVALALGAVQEDQPCRLVLPDGPEARALALVGPGARPASLPLRSGDSSEWHTYWASWAEWLGEEISAEHPSPSRRAGLALLALRQDRRRDAWIHFAATSEDPAFSAAVIPAFLPGIDVTRMPAGEGGRPPPLPDGVLLSPTTPPIPLDAQFITDWRREMSITGFRVGEALLSMRVALDYEGIQVDLSHLEGGAARVQVELPAPPEFAIGAVYLDWFPVKNESDSSIEVELLPGREARTLFGRFEPRDPAWSQALPAELPRSIDSHGLIVLVPSKIPEEFSGFDRALAGLLDVSCALVSGAAQPAATLGPATTIDLRDGASRSQRLGLLVSQVERFLLPSP